MLCRALIATWKAAFSIWRHFWGLPWCLSGKEPTCQCRSHRRLGSSPWVRKSPWRWKWHPTPVFLPGESHGQRSLAGYSPRGHRELNWVTETHTETFLTCHPGCVLLARNNWGCHQTTCCAQNRSLQHRTVQPKMSVVPRMRNPPLVGEKVLF